MKCYCKTIPIIRVDSITGDTIHKDIKMWAYCDKEGDYGKTICYIKALNGGK